MNAYLVSHNGLGDNLYMVGALRFLAPYYKTLFFLCKDIYLANVERFFTGTNIRCLAFNSRDEYADIRRILAGAVGDVFVCGPCHKHYLRGRVTTQIECAPSKYTIDHDQLTSKNYSFIEGFYRDAGLTLTHCFDYFSLPRTQGAADMWARASGFHTIFVQLKASDGRRLDISRLRERLTEEGVLVACNDENLYPPISEKFALAQTFVFQPIVHYTDLIQNCAEIYIIDSCFIGLVLPYLKTGRLKATTVRIVLRGSGEPV